MKALPLVLVLSVVGTALPVRRLRADDAAPAVTVPTYANSTCPIMGKPASRALFADTEKGRIYVCCLPCVAKVKADVERAYQAAYPEDKKAENTVCPVTGEKLTADATTVLLQGYEVGVCGTACVDKARANAQVVLTKALRPEVVDVWNRTCPVTGQPVVDNAFALVGDQLVHLSSPKCVDDLKKDPAKYLQAAKDIAAKQPPEAPASKDASGKPDSSDGKASKDAKAKEPASPTPAPRDGASK